MTKELANFIINQYGQCKTTELSEKYLLEMVMEKTSEGRKEFNEEKEKLMEHNIIRGVGKLLSPGTASTTSETILLLTMPYNSALAKIEKIYA